MIKYRHHKYTWSNPFGSVHHRWELVCAEGGVHFHVTMVKDYGPSCGLEFHSLTGDGAPDHVNCPVTGGRCWHDGTSLYAQETVWPRVESYLKTGDHESIFRGLEYEAKKHFERDDT